MPTPTKPAANMTGAQPGPRHAEPAPRRRTRRRWFHRLTASPGRNLPNEQATREPTVHAYHRELATRGQRTKHDDTLAGWWTGYPPYGYRRITQRTRDHRGRLRTRHLLSLDEHRAPVVPLIYRWYIDERLSPSAVAERLAADPARYPRPVDHASGRPRPWSRGVVSGILQNPAYTGFAVRGRTHHGTEQPVANWTWSIGPSHPPLITATQFRAAYNRRQQARQRRRTAQ